MLLDRSQPENTSIELMQLRNGQYFSDWGDVNANWSCQDPQSGLAAAVVTLHTGMWTNTKPASASEPFGLMHSLWLAGSTGAVPSSAGLGFLPSSLLTSSQAEIGNSSDARIPGAIWQSVLSGSDLNGGAGTVRLSE